MYLKIAIRNVRRAASDYSVYFLTLALAACLLYAFTSSGDYLLSMDLTSEQRDMWGAAGGIMEAFSVFMVIVFAFLVIYANRFILRRRSREFAMYGLLGMGARQVSLILLLEGVVVGVAALVIGLAAGILLSPLFGGVAAFVFDAPWTPRIAAYPSAMAWTSGCFVAIMAIATLMGMRGIARSQLIDLMRADALPDTPQRFTRVPRVLQPIVGLALNLVVWGSCILQPGIFISLIMPMGFAAVIGTGLVFRYAASRIPQRRRSRHPERYWRGLGFFVSRQVEWKVSSSANAMACTCVLMAAGICMVVAGLAFSVGMRAPESPIANAAALAPIGYVGIFYGLTFLVSAAAVLALQQLSEGADSVGRFRLLGRLGTSRAMMRGAIRRQVGVYFAVPFAFALVHCLFGLALVAFLALALGSAHFLAMVGATVGLTALLMAAYYALTCRQCTRMLL